MATLHVFTSTIPSVNYIFPNGKPAIFVSGKYHTDIKWEIEQLNLEVQSGHPHIGVDKQNPTIESEMLDPMNALRAKIIAEYVAAQAKAVNPENDMGSTDKNASIMPSNSRDIADAASGGSGVALTARLVNLSSK